MSSGKQAGAPASRPSSSDPSWLPAEGEPPVFAVSLRPYGPGDSPSAEQMLSYATLPLLKIGLNFRMLCIKCYEYSTLCPRNNLFSQICFAGKHLCTVGSTTLMVADGGQRSLTPETQVHIPCPACCYVTLFYNISNYVDRKCGLLLLLIAGDSTSDVCHCYPQQHERRSVPVTDVQDLIVCS